MNQLERINVATPDDKEALRYLLDKANAYSLQVSGTVAWKDVTKAYAILENQIDLGNVFIIRGKNRISSSITLNDINDDWGERGKDNKALYFTKFMKDPDEAEPDEAKTLLIFAAQEAKKRDKSVLRCDTVNDEIGIAAYYKGLGFEEKGRFIYPSSHKEALLLEAPVHIIYSSK